MRKVDPADIRADFADEADELIRHFASISSALVGSQHFHKDVTILASTTFLALYVGFEQFLSFLFSAYLNRDSSRFSKDLSSRVTNSLKARFGDAVASRVSTSLPKHISMTDLLPLVDPKGFNLSFSSAADIKEKANQWLAPHYRARVTSLTDEDDRLINAAKAIRDYIAHQSQASYRTLNEMLAEVSAGGGNHNLGRGAYAVYNIGSYLKAVPGNRTRLQIYAERLKDIFAKL